MSSEVAAADSGPLDFLVGSVFFSVASDRLPACSEPRCSDTVTVTASLVWRSHFRDSSGAPPNVATEAFNTRKRLVP